MKEKNFFVGFAAGIAFIMIVNFVFPTFSAGLNHFNLSLTQSNAAKDIVDEAKIVQIIDLLDKNYVDEIDRENIAKGIYTGMVYGIGDRYTSYMAPASYARFMQDMEGEFSGIGVYFDIDELDNLMTVVAPIEGSPSIKAGILPGDKIVKVDGVSVSAENYEDAIAMIKGKEGSKVSLSIYRKTENRNFDVEIVRAIITVPTVSSRMIDTDIAYINISSFAEKTFVDFELAYKSLENQGSKKLIIDLRNNPGGLLDVVSDVADFILPKGTIVYTVDKNGNRRDELSDERHIDVPIVLLVNENSASASEVLAGAIKDFEAGKLVGGQTFGKGLVQRIYPLNDGSAVKITTQRYYTPNGTSIQDIGLTPDFAVDLTDDESILLVQKLLKDEDDSQLQKAIEIVNSK